MCSTYESSSDRARCYKSETFSIFLELKLCHLSSPSGTSGKEPARQIPPACRSLKRLGFDPWVEKIPWRRAGQPTPVFLPGESPWTEEPGGLQTIWEVAGAEGIVGVHVPFSLTDLSQIEKSLAK